jgi:hypothetical protein
MSRVVQARVTDPQWSFLEYRAIEFHEGDLSAALREAIVFATHFAAILESPSPPDALRELQQRWRKEADEQQGATYMDEADDED